MDGSETCISCGFGEELQQLEVWRDADGEGVWIHPLCRDNKHRRPTYAEAVSESHRPGHTPTWEPTSDGQGHVCSLCGYVELGSDDV